MRGKDKELSILESRAFPGEQCSFAGGGWHHEQTGAGRFVLLHR